MEHEKINYIEFSVTDMEVSKGFFNSVFGWTFVDYGDEYAAFNNAGIDGGFFLNTEKECATNMGTLVVFYSSELENTQNKIISAGGEIIKEIFSFPGGRRFHFMDPAKNEFAVWSDKV